MSDWRKDGPLGTLIDAINYIKTPQQYETFSSFQTIANQDLPSSEKVKILEPVKPVVTRWNSFCSAFERAVQLQGAFNSYINYHVADQRRLDDYARAHNNKMPTAPRWMRSGGLSAHDWQVIADYVQVLQPLKMATKRLEGRGKAGRFGAIYEVIPVFEYLLESLKERIRGFDCVDFEQPNAPEDHFVINTKAAWAKLSNYYQKLDESPVYYAACCLHPYYKRYCDKAWREKPEWLTAAHHGFQQLWGEYQTRRSPPVRRKEPISSAIDDAIAAIMDDNSDDDSNLDEYEKWRQDEPKWAKQQYESADSSAIKYWVALQPKYPILARFALDVLSIPASSCECERMFSELGDLLAPRRRRIGSQLLAALQCIRAWMSAGGCLPNQSVL
jgi:hypothetical protein